jgi:tetratricopeptide (TPR) repeat protein
MLMSNLVLTYATEGDFVSAARVCDAEAETFDRPSRFSRTCGQIYTGLGRHADAERVLLQGTQRGRDQQMAHDNLADLYVRLGRREEARMHYELAIEKEPLPAMRELRRAYLLTKLYPDDPGRRREALQHIERALELQPRLVQAQELKQKLLDRQ